MNDSFIQKTKEFNFMNPVTQLSCNYQLQIPTTIFYFHKKCYFWIWS